MNNKSLLKIILILGFYSVFIVQILVEVNKNNTPSARLAYCETVHIGVVCLSTSCGSVDVYTMLKSIYFYRSDPLHFHVIVDDLSKNVFRSLFDTWNMQHVALSTYKPADFSHILGTAAKNNDNELLKLGFLLVLPSTVKNIIVVDSNLFLAEDVKELWNAFADFGDTEIIGKCHKDTGVLLLDVEKIRNGKWLDYFNTSLLNATRKRNDDVFKHTPRDSFFNLSLIDKYVFWDHLKNVMEGRNGVISVKTVKAVTNAMNDGILPRKLLTCTDATTSLLVYDSVPECSKYPEANAKTYKRRTLLYVRKFSYTPKTNDVTLITQLSYDKFSVFEETCRRWKGPISVTFYLDEEELNKYLSFIDKSPALKKRFDISYHVVFKRGQFHPVNVLRNVALNNVLTKYVFLIDVDFIPGTSVYQTIQNYLKTAKSIDKKALVVPAFSAYKPDTVIPKTTDEWKKMWKNNQIFQFQHKVFPPGHAPTDYKKLRNANKPYVVKWQPKYEPYVVVNKNVPAYDERFFAYGQNKIAQILSLVVQNYEFIVLPNTFIIHKFHKTSADFKKFIFDKSYTRCLNTLIEQHITELNRQYKSNLSYTEFLFRKH